MTTSARSALDHLEQCCYVLSTKCLRELQWLDERLIQRSALLYGNVARLAAGLCQQEIYRIYKNTSTGPRCQEQSRRSSMLRNQLNLQELSLGQTPL